MWFGVLYQIAAGDCGKKSVIESMLKLFMGSTLGS